MKALSIRQPWAWLIVNGHKDIENRTWPTRVRGRVLIHASKGMTRGEYEDVEDYLCEVFETGPHDAQFITLPKFEALERGGIVGVATITDCVASERRASTWHMEGQFGFQVADAKVLPFMPCKGALGFFDVPKDVADALRAMHGQQGAQSNG